MFIAWLARWWLCPNRETTSAPPNRADRDRRRGSIRPGKTPASRRTNDRWPTYRDSSYPLFDAWVEKCAKSPVLRCVLPRPASNLKLKKKFDNSGLVFGLPLCEELQTMTLRTMILALPAWPLSGLFRRAAAQEGAALAPNPQSKAAAAPARTDWRATGKEGAVAAGGLGAVEAGLEILKAGGNAADSAAATIFALSVTDSRSFCFGGEVPILIYDAKHQTVTVIDGQGAAPRLATLDHFKGPGGIPAGGSSPRPCPPRSTPA